MSYHLSRRQFLRLATRVIGTTMGITCTFTARTFGKEVRRVQVELKASVLQPTHWPDGTPKEEGFGSLMSNFQGQPFVLERGRRLGSRSVTRCPSQRACTGMVCTSPTPGLWAV